MLKTSQFLRPVAGKLNENAVNAAIYFHGLSATMRQISTKDEDFKVIVPVSEGTKMLKRANKFVVAFKKSLRRL